MLACSTAAAVTALLLATLVPDAVEGNRNAVGQTPIMGWSGYNAFMQNSGHCDKAGAGGYNEQTFIQTAEVLVKTGLRDLGFVYLNLDGIAAVAIIMLAAH